jgi:hypothetical protein
MGFTHLEKKGWKQSEHGQALSFLGSTTLKIVEPNRAGSSRAAKEQKRGSERSTLSKALPLFSVLVFIPNHTIADKCNKRMEERRRMTNVVHSLYLCTLVCRQFSLCNQNLWINTTPLLKILTGNKWRWMVINACWRFWIQPGQNNSRLCGIFI